MLETFDALEEHSLFGRLYVYIFSIIFTIIVLRVMLAALQYFVFLQGSPHRAPVREP